MLLSWHPVVVIALLLRLALSSLQGLVPLFRLEDVALDFVNLLTKLLCLPGYLVNCSVWQSLAHILVKDPELLFEVRIASSLVLALLLVVHGH